MRFFRSLVLASALVFAGDATCTNTTTPVAPGLEFLYTAIADCKTEIYNARVPKGIRSPIPIVGGNFTGPRLNGKILNLGADWGLVDPRTGIFNADTRYQLQTYDGANIFIQTSGSEQPDTSSHLRIIFETGDERYYWMNSVVAVGILNVIATYEGGYTLQIDAWNVGYTTSNSPIKFTYKKQLAGEWKETRFLNGTM